MEVFALVCSLTNTLNLGISLGIKWGKGILINGICSIVAVAILICEVQNG